MHPMFHSCIQYPRQFVLVNGGGSMCVWRPLSVTLELDFDAENSL